MNAKATFRTRLFELCKNKTQQELANDLGISRQTIGFYLNGDRSPDIENLTKIAKYFGVTTDYLIGLSDAKKAENAHCVDDLLLNEDTVELLKRWAHMNEYCLKKSTSDPYNFSFLLNALIVNAIRTGFLSDLSYYCHSLQRAISNPDSIVSVRELEDDEDFEEDTGEDIGIDRKTNNITFSSVSRMAQSIGCELIATVEQIEYQEYTVKRKFDAILNNIIFPLHDDYLIKSLGVYEIKRTRQEKDDGDDN